VEISDEKLGVLISEQKRILLEKEELYRQCVAAKDQAELQVAAAENRFLQLKEVQRLRGLSQTDKDHPYRIRYDGEWWALEGVYLNLRMKTVTTSRRLLGSEERASSDSMALDRDIQMNEAAKTMIVRIKERMYPDPEEGSDVI
jgi:hypothetical protein